MNVKRVKGIECPECGEFISEDALSELTEWYQCGECQTVFKERDEATECCKE